MIILVQYKNIRFIEIQINFLNLTTPLSIINLGYLSKMNPPVMPETWNTGGVRFSRISTFPAKIYGKVLFSVTHRFRYAPFSLRTGKR